MARKSPSRQPTAEELLKFFRSLDSAKPFRAGMMHYTVAREQQGPGHAITNDAELNAYKQALALAEEVKNKIDARRKS